MEELNLGLQSAVFIDDNPMERARVSEALPEVLVPEWPNDKMLYRKVLLSLKCFDTPMMSDEDGARIKMYKTERKRERLKTSVSSPEEWLKTLKMKVLVETLNDRNIKRIVQLMNKTNQMNLSTRRMTETELLNWTEIENRHFLAFRVSDRFGDYGLTGIASMEHDGQAGRMMDFILSCRVMGRKIEEVMLSVMTIHANSLGLIRMEAKYLETPKNQPCHDFWKRSGFSTDKANEIFTWELDVEYPKPNFVEIED
jgi:FkbH-like protein